MGTSDFASGAARWWTQPNKLSGVRLVPRPGELYETYVLSLFLAYLLHYGHDVIHKSGSTYHIALPSDKDRATATGNMYNNFVEVWTCGYLAEKVKQSVSSVCLSVCLFPLFLLNRLNFELEFLCVEVMNIARLRMKVRVIGQGRGQRSMSSTYGRGNAVTRSVWSRSSIKDIFYLRYASRQTDIQTRCS